jgi:hypothetical protein
VVHYLARHGESRVAKAVIISAVPPQMVGLAVWTSVVSIPIVIYNREFLRKILPESMMIKPVRIIDIGYSMTMLSW